MNENAGVIRLETLIQSDHWVDRHGSQHALTDMTQGYLQNVLGYLRDGAARLYELELSRQEGLLLIAEIEGWTNGMDASILDRGQAAAEAWLENTPLVTALRTMLGGTSRQAQ
ncbi:hypothetical protein [Paenarthrobacter sp. YJN-5]|uniref:hypothetical protein n=1 Tax=Paenarthrobacter sp. YJN-5 TaxID=2735316 RepID=UPI0018782D0F|nr:hypothetical protein [Paenarthrobacter sp. YJN-5]QOT19282.1 hypothetical protein HMI59_21515 [Paenarthrobacter sp. YJN-5]